MIKKHNVSIYQPKQKEKNMKQPGLLLNLEIYQTDIEFLFGEDKREFVNMWLNTSVKSGLTYKTPSGSFFVWVSDIDNKNILVHEIYHVVNWLAKDRGFSEDDVNEAQAYLMGHVFEEVEKGIKLLKKKKNVKKNKKLGN